MRKSHLLILVLFYYINLIGQNGTVKTYYPSGKVESRIAFIEGILEGTSFWYYSNGNIKGEKQYKNGILHGIERDYYSSGLLKIEKHFLNGILDGVSSSYYENGSLREVRIYNKGQLENVNHLDYDSLYIAPLEAYEAGRKKNIKSEGDFICSLEICPEPVGGIEEIEANIIYPELARKYQLEGNVLISATISKRGKAKNIKIVKGLGLGCDEAAIDAVKSTNFIPGRNNGTELESVVTFSLKFSLDKISNSLLNKGLFQRDNNFSENNKKDEQVVKRRFITCMLESCPEPEGGIIELLRKLRYPSQAKRNNIEGDVIILARVNELGFVIKAEVKKGIGYGCDESAVSTIIKTQFKPGKEKGVDTEADIEIVVPFILEEK